ncbi:MAG: SDR family oxidoreductase [bacterium]|nr:SDR family oxidoreductase [bacterium]
MGIAKNRLFKKVKGNLYSIGGNKGSRTVLITGASGGLGASFADIFAKNGFNVVLTARRKDKLKEQADKIEKKYGVRTTLIAVDLADPAGPQHIFDECEKMGIEVDALINNAGLAIPGFYQETEWKKHNDFLQLMITAPSQLSYLFEAGMVKRGYGRIINVSSFVGTITPTGSYTLYGAAKSYLIKFSQAHAEELKGTGVKVMALCPGFFKSELHDETDESQITSQLPARMFLDVDTVAEEGYDKIMNTDEVVYVNGRIYQLMGNMERSNFSKIRGKGALRSYADRVRTKLNSDGSNKQSGTNG